MPELYKLVSLISIAALLLIIMRNERARKMMEDFKISSIKAMFLVGVLNGWLILTEVHLTATRGFSIWATSLLMSPIARVETLIEDYPMLEFEDILPGNIWAWQAVMILGMIFGSFIASYMSGEFKIRLPRRPTIVVQICIGGFLMGFGLRLALACNVGTFFEGIPSLALGSLITGGGIIAGSYMVSRFVIKRQCKV